MSSKQAFLIGTKTKHNRLEQRVYRMVPPHEGFTFVVASKIPGETMLFGCKNEKGQYMSYDQNGLSGSTFGDVDCDEVIRNAGYTLVGEMEKVA